MVVQREPHPPFTTDFLSCVACGLMYYAPITERERLLADAKLAAKDYLKPSRQPRPGDWKWKKRL